MRVVEQLTIFDTSHCSPQISPVSRFAMYFVEPPVTAFFTFSRITSSGTSCCFSTDKKESNRIVACSLGSSVRLLTKEIVVATATKSSFVTMTSFAIALRSRKVWDNHYTGAATPNPVIAAFGEIDAFRVGCGRQ